MPPHLAFVVNVALVLLALSALIWLCDESGTYRGLSVILFAAACGFFIAAVREYGGPWQSGPPPGR